MTIDWGSSWVWGLGLVTVTTGLHALGIVHLVSWLEDVRRFMERHYRHGLPRPRLALRAVWAIGLIGMLVTILHGIEAMVWAVAYVWVGAVVSVHDAILYSLDSMTTRGASGIQLTSEWRLLGALEAADGMILFGITTAFMFAVLQQIIPTPSDASPLEEGISPERQGP